jgi:hypothetical protein
MAESSPELEEILASLHRMALGIAKSPKSEREAAYEVIRASLADTRRALNFGAGFEDNYMAWLRALVDMLERGGGAPGGKA